MNPKVGVSMYKAILLPKLLYASVVWWPMVSRVEAKNVLRCIQGSYLRDVVGSVRMTPTEAQRPSVRLSWIWLPLEQQDSQHVD
jgi:hypothetical protein